MADGPCRWWYLALEPAATGGSKWARERERITLHDALAPDTNFTWSILGEGPAGVGVDEFHLQVGKNESDGVLLGDSVPLPWISMGQSNAAMLCESIRLMFEGRTWCPECQNVLELLLALYVYNLDYRLNSLFRKLT